jgi:hypothetical protein
MTPEARVKHALKKMLKEEFPQVWTYWPVSNGMGAHGIPDLIICAGGMFIGAEVKAPGKKVTLLQANQLHKIEMAQGTPLILVGDEAVPTLRTYLSCLHLPKQDFSIQPTLARTTQQAYGTLAVKDPNTIYVLTD